MNNPLVSILMPVYNAGKYLRQAIDGVLNQTFTDFEFVIINDGSTDNSEEIIKSYNDSRIVYIKKENSGVASSLNLGLEKAKGDLIWRHDSDDISNKQALEKEVTYLQKNKDIAMVSTQIAFMSANGKIAYKYRNPKNDFYEGKYDQIITKDNYWQNRPIIHATILVKKEVLIDLGGYRVQFPTAEDIDLWFRILERNNAAVINECNYFVRLHESSNTSSHGLKNKFYRDLAYTFFKERDEFGNDPLMRGEEMPVPLIKSSEENRNNNLLKVKKGRLFRADILDFRYLIYLNSKDCKLIIKSLRIALHDGYKLKQTWKAIIFPIIGEKIIKLGVRIKKKIR